MLNVAYGAEINVCESSAWAPQAGARSAVIVHAWPLGMKDHMTDVTPEKTRGLGRRTLLRNGLIVGLGAAAATVAVPALTGVAQATSAQYQLGWGWCSKCSAMFFLAPAGGMNRTNGVCPTGGKHGYATSDIYYMWYNWNPQPSNVQQAWFYCYKCAGMFYQTASGNAGVCPDGGSHDLSNDNGAYSFAYGLYYGGESGYQANWLYCDSCAILFYCNDPTGNNYQAGVCPARDHTAHLGHPSFNYDVLSSGQET
jgi:hypothetical protein